MNEKTLKLRDMRPGEMAGNVHLIIPDSVVERIARDAAAAFVRMGGDPIMIHVDVSARAFASKRPAKLSDPAVEDGLKRAIQDAGNGRPERACVVCGAKNWDGKECENCRSYCPGCGLRYTGGNLCPECEARS